MSFGDRYENGKEGSRSTRRGHPFPKFSALASPKQGTGQPKGSRDGRPGTQNVMGRAQANAVARPGLRQELGPDRPRVHDL